MDTIYKVATGIVLFIITSLLTYLFRVRQLYVVAPSLFKRTQVSAAGSVCQIMIYNNGNRVEEDIKVSIDPALKIELIASDSTELAVSQNILTIDRLHKSKTASALVLIENGEFDHTKITSITSKEAVGKIFKKTGNVPPNWAKYFLLMVCLLLIAPSLIGGFELYEYVSSKYFEYRLQAEYKLGWHGLEAYYTSELRKSYGDQEFPVSFVKFDKSASRNVAVFEIYNKTAVPLSVYADKNHNVLSDLSKADTSNFVSVEVAPMSHSPLIVPMPQPDTNSHQPEISFKFESGSEFLIGSYYVPRGQY